jgi:guanine deaminase
MRAWLEAGLNVGIGTDGTTCSDNMNAFEAMRIATLVSRVRGDTQERWIGAREAFDAATRGGAKLLGMDDVTGSIAPGKIADLVFLDLNSTHYLPLNDLLNQIVYAEDGTGVDSVMTGGEFVYRHRKHTRVDLARLRTQAEQAAEAWRAKVAPLKQAAERLEPYVGRYCWGIRARVCDSGCAHTMVPVGPG